MQKDWTQDFVENCLYRMGESMRMLQICMEKTPDDRFWERENPALNSPGNLLQHLSGNIRQYVISGLGGGNDNRQRDSEFQPRPGRSRQEVWEDFRQTVREAGQVIRSAKAGDLLEPRSVQGFTFSGMGLVIHAVEHLSYHTGQMAYLVKLRTEEDLGFYSGVDLNKKNT